MLIYDLEQGNSDQWIVCLHGLKGNKDSVKQITSNLKNFNKLFVQAPIQLSDGEYTWFDEFGNLAVGIDGDFIELLQRFKVNSTECWWLGFSQGGVVIFSLASKIKICKVCALCSFVLEDLPDNYNGESLFWYSSLDDQQVSFFKSFSSFQKAASKYNQTMFVTGKSGHKISAKGLKALAFWLGV